MHITINQNTKGEETMGISSFIDFRPEKTLKEANRMLAIKSGWHKRAQAEADYMAVTLMRILAGEHVTPDEIEIVLSRCGKAINIPSLALKIAVAHADKNMKKLEAWTASGCPQGED